MSSDSGKITYEEAHENGFLERDGAGRTLVLIPRDAEAPEGVDPNRVIRVPVRRVAAYGFFDVATLISFLSTDRTLPAGTVILTGTPEGVGFARQPPLWLQDGDTVQVSIEGLGTLSHPVVATDA